MYTSYFGNKKQWSKYKNVVAISFSTPHYFTGRTYHALAPTMSLVQALKKRKITKQKYIQIYESEVLRNLDPQQVFNELKEDAVLLCWDTPNKFCHRFLVKDWLERKLSITIEELPNVHSNQLHIPFAGGF